MQREGRISVIVESSLVRGVVALLLYKQIKGTLNLANSSTQFEAVPTFDRLKIHLRKDVLLLGELE